MGDLFLGGLIWGGGEKLIIKFYGMSNFRGFVFVFYFCIHTVRFVSIWPVTTNAINKLKQQELKISTVTCK